MNAVCKGLIAVRSPSAHAPRHKAACLRMTIQIVRPDHRAASAVRSVYNSVLRNIDPLAVDAYAIVIVLSVPIGVIDALRVRAVAAGPFAAMQARKPTV